MDTKRALILTLVLTALVATVALLLAISAPPPAQAQSKPQGASIQNVADGQSVSGERKSDETWGPGTITVTGDITIVTGVIVTISQGTTIQMTTTDGLAGGIDTSRIEYIVSGTLRANGPVTFTSQSPTPRGSDWYGIRFRPLSSGWLDHATVEYGIVGVSIEGASPSLTYNTIRYMRGPDGLPGAPGAGGADGSPGTGGSPAYGIHITSTSNSTIQHNQVYSITGGMGGIGGIGSSIVLLNASNSMDLSMQIDGALPAGAGGSGGAGALATGIFAGNGATPQVQMNTVMTITGGAGGWGGLGGNGENGDGSSHPDGYPGGDGGPGAEGGAAYGIHFQDAGSSSPADHNVVHDVQGGNGGRGGNGGHGGPATVDAASGDAGEGGDGGNGGNSGHGGRAIGIYLERSSPDATDNDIDNIRGGSAQGGGDGGPGGPTEPGRDNSSEPTMKGGDGGSPGAGGTGGYGSNGGPAHGIRVEGPATPDVLRNTIDVVHGGHGGPGGAGGNGGYGGTGAEAHGIHVLYSDASPELVDNRVNDVQGGNGGQGGLGGNGGNGTNGGNGGHVEDADKAGDGGKGGDGQSGGDGGQGGPGGRATGLYIESAIISSPVLRNALADIHGGLGGLGGDAGLAGQGGTGGNGGNNAGEGVGGNGGAGGNGGHGGNAGHGGAGSSASGILSTGDMAAEILSAGPELEAINNLVHDVGGGNGQDAGIAGDGGTGGDGGAGGIGVGGAGAGGAGGIGGNAGNGHAGGNGGHSSGLEADGGSADYTHNTSADIEEDAGAPGLGTPAGTAGVGGTGGAGTPPGPPGSPGSDGEDRLDGTAGDSVGLWADGATVTATNNIIAHTSPPGPNTYGIRAESATPTLSHNDVWSHNVQYDGVSAPASDIQQDPQFVNWTSNDFHLTQGSPCVDAGTEAGVDHDYDQQARPQGNDPDMGFDEVIPLTYTKAVDLSTASPGQELVYTLVVSNPDPNALAVGGLLQDVIPPDTTYDSGPDCVPGTCEYLPATQTVQWEGNIAADAALTLVYTVTVNSEVTDGALVTNTAYLTMGNQSGWTNAVTTALRVTEPQCIEVAWVELSLVSTEPIRVGSPAEFEANISPDDAGKPYTYTLEVDGTAGMPQISNDDPLTFEQTFTKSGTRTVEIAVWNCTMTGEQAPKSSFKVQIRSAAVFLPLVLKNR